MASEFYSVSRYETTVFLYEFIKVQLTRRIKESTWAQIEHQWNSIEGDLFVPYFASLRRQVAARNSEEKVTLPPACQPQIEETFLMKLNQLTADFTADRTLHQVFTELTASLKKDVQVMKHCVDCIKSWYLHSSDVEDPFPIPCGKPHLLVWVKRDQMYLPAKLIAFEDNKALVSYFGESRFIEHISSLNRILLLTKTYPKLMSNVSGKRSSVRVTQSTLAEPMNQLKKHVDLLNRHYSNELQIYHEEDVSHRLSDYIKVHGCKLCPRKDYSLAPNVASTSQSTSTPDLLYQKLLETGSTSISSLEMFQKYSKMQPVVKLEKVQLQNTEALNTQQSNLSTEQSVTCESQGNSLSEETSNLNRSQNEETDERLPVSDASEISSTDACCANLDTEGDIEEQNSGTCPMWTDNDVNEKEESLSSSLSKRSLKSSNSANKIEELKRIADTLAHQVSDLKSEHKKRVKNLKRKFEKKFLQQCTSFNPSSDFTFQLAKRHYENELAKIKRTTWCSVCKIKAANIQLSLNSANNLQWHPYNNNYAFCSNQCKWKSQMHKQSMEKVTKM